MVPQITDSVATMPMSTFKKKKKDWDCLVCKANMQIKRKQHINMGLPISYSHVFLNINPSFRIVP